LTLEPIAHDARVHAHHFSLMSRNRESSEQSFSMSGEGFDYFQMIEGTRVDEVEKAKGHVRSCQEGLRPIKDWYERRRAPNLWISETSKP
jgi:hypothetical protein